MTFQHLYQVVEDGHDVGVADGGGAFGYLLAQFAEREFLAGLRLRIKLLRGLWVARLALLGPIRR